MGLWDSVNSVGVFYDRIFPYTFHINIVKHIRHAISIDERRGKFKQYPFFPHVAQITRCRQDDHITEGPCSKSDKSDRISSNKSVWSSVFMPWSRNSIPPSPTNTLWSELLDAPRPNEPTQRNAMGYFTPPPVTICEDVRELWFPGDHSDIGGGHIPNDEGQNVSNIAMRWMLTEAFKAGCLFRDGALTDFDNRYPLSKSLRAPLHDKLNLKRRSDANMEGIRGSKDLFQSCFWWLLELLPIFSYKLSPTTDRWSKSIAPNRGRHRTIPLNVKFHWSVRWRMIHLNYMPVNVTRDHILDGFDETEPVESHDELKRVLEENPVL